MDVGLDKKLFLWAALTAVIGGIIAFILGMVLGPINAIPARGAIIAGVIAVVLLIYLAKSSDFDSVTIFQLIVILVLIGVIGTIITTIFPPAAPYILTVAGNFTALGLGFTFIYIMLADIVINKLNIG